MNLTKNTDTNHLVPTEFYLCQNYPNPFNEKTIIKFCVAYKTKVKLEVFNSEGKMIKTLLDEEKEAGTYEVKWNIKNLPKGDYFTQFKAGNFISRKKLTIIK